MRWRAAVGGHHPGKSALRRGSRSETLRTQASQLRENCGESIPGRRESKCKSPEMEKGLTPLRKTKEARDLEHGEERGERREERGEKEERGIC